MKPVGLSVPASAEPPVEVMLNSGDVELYPVPASTTVALYLYPTVAPVMVKSVVVAPAYTALFEMLDQLVPALVETSQE